MFNKYIPYIIFSSFLILLIIILSIVYFYYDSQKLPDIKPIHQPINKVCITLDEYNKLKNNDNNDNVISSSKNHTVDRDYRVINDQLYPPLNRSDNRTHTDMVENINRRNLYIRTNDINDTYRLVGYLTNNSDDKDTGNNNWKLFARQKDRHISDFYMKPTDNNNDIKVSITDDIVVGDRLRDIYNIPNKITFNSPMLNKTPYDVIEVPKADLSRSADYI